MHKQPDHNKDDAIKNDVIGGDQREACGEYHDVAGGEHKSQEGYNDDNNLGSNDSLRPFGLETSAVEPLDPSFYSGKISARSTALGPAGTLYTFLTFCRC